MLNNPLTLVDPSGFEPLPMLPGSEFLRPGGPLRVWVFGEPRKPREPNEGGTNPNAELGASAPPTDVGVTGDSPSDASEAPPGISLDDVRRNPYVQLEGGFISGLLLGLVPYGGMGQQTLDAARVLPHVAVTARIGFSVGLLVGGIVTLLEGVGGDVAGGAATATVVGAPVGVPAIVVSTAVAVGGMANIAAGFGGLLNALSQGSGSAGPTPPAVRDGTLKPGPYAKESIPAHRGRPTAEEQRQVNKLMKEHGCHTCGTKDPGTRSGNAVADHQPPQALGEPERFYPQCNGCKARQGGEVRQQVRKNQVQ